MKMMKIHRPIARILIIAVLVICMSFAMPSMDAFALELADMTVGVDAGSIRVFYSDSLSACTYSSGSLSPGLSLSYIPNDGVYLKGTPSAAGTYSASYNVTTASGVETLTLNFTVRSASSNVPEDEYLPVTTPTPTKTPQPAGTAPKITKHPTGETVEVGDAAKFIARADNATKFTWRIVSKDPTCTYKATEAEYYFPGLEVSGENTDTLILSSIPASMDSWSVECMFQNDYGNSFTNGAIITVIKNQPAATPAPTKAPAANNQPDSKPEADTQPEEEISTSGSGKTANITTQPRGAQVEKGETVTLQAYATSPNNGDVSYQWYSAPVNDVNAALPIGGATGEEYTVTPTADVVYYWAAVWNTKEGVRSDAVFTQSAAVSLIPEATPTPAPTPVPSPVDDGSDFLSGNIQLILFGVIGLLALAALIGVVIYLRIEAKRDDE